MSVWILTGSIGVLERTVLVDSEHERPLPIEAFESSDDAEEFLRYAHAIGFSDRDLPRMSRDSIDRLHSLWLASRETAPETIDDEADLADTLEASLVVARAVKRGAVEGRR